MSPARTQAGVLVPVWRDTGGALRIVLIRRAERGLHAGEIGLPGGKAAPEDRGDLAATAVRETSEELGVGKDTLAVVERLAPVHTVTTGFSIQPFLARIERPAAWIAEPSEVAAVVEPRIAELAAPDAHTRERIAYAPPGTGIDAACLRVGEVRVWGATYRILQPLLTRLAHHPAVAE